MALPASFQRDGFEPMNSVRNLKRLLIGTEGESDTGKSEFLFSCPGPGMVVVVDRMLDGMLNNSTPPKSRRSDFGVKVIKVPVATSAAPDVFKQYWIDFRETFYRALDNRDAKTVCIDGDTDSWELQRLAAFGKLTQIPAIMYTEVNSARKAMIARAWDSGKVIVATNKVKPLYKTKTKLDGTPVVGNDGKEVREKSGELERQGFGDTDYLWHIQLRHFYNPSRTNAVTKKEVPGEWGFKILKCKPNPSLVGYELTGEDATFKGLVQAVYPDAPLSTWGL